MTGGDASKALGIDGANHAAAVEGAFENLEARIGEDIGHVRDLKAESRVGFIRAVAVHGFLIGHAQEGQGHIDSAACFEHGGDETFDERDDVVLLYEAGLDIDLSELRLTVGAEVFVTETAGDLEITLEAGDHEELLVLLRSLGKRKKLARAETGRHEEVARAFGCWVREDGRLHFDEALGVEVIPSSGGDLVPSADVAVQALAAEVEVTVFHPQILIGKLAVELEGQHVGFVQDGESGGDDLHLARADFAIFRAFEAGGHFALNLEDIFVTQVVTFGGELRVLFRTEDNLGEALAVAEVDEDDATVVACRIHPSAELDALPDVGLADFVAMVGAVGVGDHG